MLRELPLPITDRDEGTRLMSSPKKVVSMELIVRIKFGLDRSLAEELLKTRDTRCLVGDSCLLPAAVVVAVADSYHKGQFFHYTETGNPHQRLQLRYGLEKKR